MKTIKIGIATQEAMRQRVLAIAKGDLKPQPDDPKVWFTSVRSLDQALGDENGGLLEAIRTSPAPITASSGLTGHKQSHHLFRTLKTMSCYGSVQMEKNPGGLRSVVQAECCEMVAC